MIYPKPLKPGDTLAIVATSGPCDPVRLKKGVSVLESLGFRCRVMESCYARAGFLAGADALRLNDLHAAFADPGVQGIIAARGGYGAQRLLPGLDIDLIRRNPKIFAGYSDVTALHIVLNQVCRLVTFHAPMPVSDFGGEVVNDETVGSFVKTLGHCPKNVNFRVDGFPQGVLIGGNLTVIASSLGTPYEIDTGGKILFLEEINEDLYRIDRMLLQLKYAGKLSAAAGIVLGDFTPHCPEDLVQTLNDIIKPLNIPYITGFPCGHCSPTLTLPLGASFDGDASSC